MKVGAQLLLACVVLAAIKAAVMGLLIAAALGGMICFLQRPRETLATVAVLGATVAFVAHPGIIVAGTGAIVLGSYLVQRTARYSTRRASGWQLFNRR